ncbi:MAG TPA: Ig-like domain-containing protein [Pyrinomonadaceae bacterium]|nr:Ig-like domain-containing protein [Pyrinomonadaceae bacterium]
MRSPLQIRFQILSLVLIHCLAISAFGSLPRAAGSKKVKKQPFRITFDPPEPTVERGQRVRVRAIVTDVNGAEIPGAKVVWEVPPSAAEFIEVNTPLNSTSTTDIIIVGIGRAATSATAAPVNITLTARSGASARGDLLVHFKPSAPTPPGTISFTPLEEISVTPGFRTKISAEARDGNGTAIPATQISWEIDGRYKDFVELVGAEVVGTRSEATVIATFPSDPKTVAPSSIPILARAGATSGVVLVNYQPFGPAKSTISFDKTNLSITPETQVTFKVTVKTAQDQEIKNARVEAEIPDELKEFAVLSGPDKDNVFTLTGRAGNPKSTAPAVIPITVRSRGETRFMNVSYQRGSITTMWEVLPPNIVGDNFGRTIKDDYYCIEVSIKNQSGSDLHLSQIGFDLNGEVPRPNTSYSTVSGSLMRRKLLHPRSLALAFITSLGTLLTGFNPYFHNINHAKNYSQGIDIISNPLRSGVEAVWKDTVPDEMSRLEAGALRDDIVIQNGGSIRTKIFFPKRALFGDRPEGNNNLEKEDKNDLKEVRKRLGKLVLEGYKFQRGESLNPRNP